MKKRIVVEVICFLFIVLFVYAAINKLADVQKFQVQLGQSPLLSPFASWIAWVVPIVEIGVCILLSFSRWRLYGLYAAFGLMAMFSAYIIAITQFSDYVPCSCGGILEKLGWTEHLIFNIVFVLLGILGIVLYTKPEPTPVMN